MSDGKWAEGLNERQRIFCVEYAKDQNGSRAARVAGYSEKRAGVQAHSLIRKPKIQKALSVIMQTEGLKLGISPRDVLGQWASIAFLDIRDLITWDKDSMSFIPSGELTKENAAAVQSIKAKTVHIYPEDGPPRTEITLELKTYDKLKALDRLAQYTGIISPEGGNYVNNFNIQRSGPEDLTDDELIERLSSLVKEARDGVEVRTLPGLGDAMGDSHS